MATTISKLLLSGSTDGQGIAITASQGATPNTIHTGVSGATSTIDEVWIYANNNYSQALELAIEWGASSAPQTITHTLSPKDGAQIVVPGFLIMGSATAAADIVAYITNTTASVATSATAMVSLYGYVNRIVQT